MSDAIRLAQDLRGELRHDEPMAKHVSWRAGGRAKLFYQPADVEDLQAFLAARPEGEPILFVGLGSNLLVRDGGTGLPRAAFPMGFMPRLPPPARGPARGPRRFRRPW